MARRKILEQLLAAVPPPRTAAQARERAEPEAFDGPRRRAGFSLPGPLLDRFRELCAENGLVQRVVVEELLSAWVREHAGLLDARRAG